MGQIDRVDRFVTIDFETYWDEKYSLAKIGPLEYIRSPLFEAQLLGVRIDQGETFVVEGDDNIKDALYQLRLYRKGTYVIGHNLNGFDALVLSERYGVKPYCMIDTICLARLLGISRFIGESHKELTAWFKHGVKTAGTEISKGKRWRDFTTSERDAFKQYCSDDVTQCSDNFISMMKYAINSGVDNALYAFCSITAKMATEPSLIIDVERLRTYIASLDARAEEVAASLRDKFGFSDQEEMLKAVRSPLRFPELLRSLGVEPPMKLSSKTGEMKPALSKTDDNFKALLDHPNPLVSQLVATRLEFNSSIQRSRAATLLKLGEMDTRLPVLLNAFKADTGRYTAGSSEGTDGINMQNMSKRDPSQLELRRCIRAPEGHVVVACDSSQIEARMLAYVAGQHDLVEQFAEGRDPYAELAAQFSPYSADDIHNGAKAGDKDCKKFRNAGKTAILSCGYGVGWRKYADTLWLQGCALGATRNSHDNEAMRIHSIYRMTNSAIVFFWKQCHILLSDAASGVKRSRFGGPHDAMFEMLIDTPAGGDMRAPCIRMPLGYRMWYPGLRREQDGFVYDRRRGKNVIKQNIYGGMMTENVIQSASFLLLVWQAVQMQKKGLSLAGNIHDSWFVVVPESEAQWASSVMKACMSSVPEWLPGFPVACEVEVGCDYTVA